MNLASFFSLYPHPKNLVSGLVYPIQTLGNHTYCLAVQGNPKAISLYHNHHAVIGDLHIGYQCVRLLSLWIWSVNIGLAYTFTKKHEDQGCRGRRDISIYNCLLCGAKDYGPYFWVMHRPYGCHEGGRLKRNVLYDNWYVKHL